MDNGVLVALWAENALVGERRVLQLTIDAGVVQQAAAARKLLLDQLQTQEATPDSIMRPMEACKCYMGTVDRFWKIEFAFWQSRCNGEAEKSVQDAILAPLPTVDPAVTLIDAFL